jgi:hypothetical protein
MIPIPGFLRRALIVLLLCAICFVAGGVLLGMRNRQPPLPDPAALIIQIREVARLETLDVALYKKVSFEPDPVAQKTAWGDVIEFAKFTLNAPKGRAIIFADVHLGIDLQQLDPSALNVQGSSIEVTLPPLIAQVELKPAETEVIGSNLDSQQTAALFDKAKHAFEIEAKADPVLRRKAQASTERAVRALLLSVGFREVKFVDRNAPKAPAL